MIEAQGEPGSSHIQRVCALLSGTTYSPKVCDLTMCSFRDGAAALTGHLAFPFDVRIASRDNRVSDRFMCADARTSSKFAAMLADLQGAMRLKMLDYSIPIAVDGSLFWSRVVGAKDLGSFWSEGQRLPWGSRAQPSAAARQLAKNGNLLQQMSLDDPFATAPLARSSAGVGLGRRTSGKHGGSAPDRLAKVSHQGTLQAASSLAASSGNPGVGIPIEGNAAAQSGASDKGELEDMDLAEHDLDALEDEDFLELQATYGGNMAELDAATMVIDDIEDRVVEPLRPQAPDERAMEEFAKVVAEVSEQDGQEASQTEPVATASSTDGPLVEAGGADADAPILAPQEPWEQMGNPSASGYVSWQGRSVMRSQRGRPARRLTDLLPSPQVQLVDQLGSCATRRRAQAVVLRAWAGPAGCQQRGRCGDDNGASRYGQGPVDGSHPRAESGRASPVA